MVAATVLDMKRAALASAAACALLFIVVCYVSSRPQSVGWDEMIDLKIAASLAVDPVVGSRADPSQARLPMYVSAAIIAFQNLARGDNHDDKRNLVDTSLPCSRLVSCFFGGLTVLLLFLYLRRHAGDGPAILATVLLGLSAYFINGSRYAMTHGDPMVAHSSILILFACERFAKAPTRSAHGLLAASVAYAIALKFTMLIVAVGLGSAYVLQAAFTNRFPLWARRSWRDWTSLALAVASAAIVYWDFRSSQAANTTMYGGALFCMLASVGVLAPLPVSASPSGSKSPPDLLAWGHVLVIGIVGAFILVPAHYFNPSIAESFVTRASTGDGQGYFSHVVPCLILYSGIILLKLGLPLGFASLIGLFWGWAQIGRESVTGRLAFACVFYLLFLCALPLTQSNYLMPIYPLIVALTALFLDAWLRRSIRYRLTVRLIVFAMIVVAVINLVRSYPLFGLVGRETVGDRWYGHRVTGPRHPVLTSSEGIWGALNWIASQETTRPRVAVVCNDEHVALYYKLTHANRMDLRVHRRALALKQNLDQLDYVLFSRGKLPARGDALSVAFQNWQQVYSYTAGSGVYTFTSVVVLHNPRN